MSQSARLAPDTLDRLPGLDNLVRQGLYRGGLGDQVGTLRGTLGWENPQQEVDLPEVPVIGTMPTWISGMLLRSGPGKWDLGSQELNHWTGAKAVLSAVPVEAGNPGYRHHFSITEHYVIAMEYPLRIDLHVLATGDKPFAASLRLDPAAATKLFVIDRADGTLVKVLGTDGFFAMHHANAYEDGDTIVMDVAAYDNAEHT